MMLNKREPPPHSLFCRLQSFKGRPVALSPRWRETCFDTSLIPHESVKHVTEKDMKSIENTNFVNDNAIDAYLQLVVKSAACHQFGRNVYVMNCFFYTILTKNGREGFGRSRDMNSIFQKELLIIPIHDLSHWVIAFVDVQNCVITVADSLARENDDIERNIVRYLAEEAKSQGYVDRFLNWDVCDLEVPEQNNGYDCGIYICQFARYLTRGYTLTSISHLYMQYFRRRMIYELICGYVFKDNVKKIYAFCDYKVSKKKIKKEEILTLH